MTGANVNGGDAGWTAVMVALPEAPDLITINPPFSISAMAGLLMVKVAGACAVISL